MSGLPAEQVLNIYVIRTYTIYKNCGILMTEYNDGLYSEVSKI